MSDANDLVELFRTQDSLRARMVRELLEAEGIPVATPGLEHREMIGVLGGYVEVIVKVPKRELARAQELVDSLDAAPLVEPEEDDEDDVVVLEHRPGYRTQAARRVRTTHGKRRRIATFAAMLIPGGGHFYVGETKRGAIVALLAIAALVLLQTDAPFVILFWPLAVLADIVGSTWHCERLARPDQAPSARRFAPEIAAAVASAWLLLILGPGAAWLAGPGSTALCEASAACTGEPPRSCLWLAHATRMEEMLPRSCFRCVEQARTCRRLAQCETCFGD